MQRSVYAWEDIDARTVIAGFHGRFIHSGAATFALWTIDAGAILPQHDHPHEQVVHQLAGELEVTVDGVTSVLRPGMVAVIPPHAVHSGRALTDCRVMDVFNPPRDDYRESATQTLLQRAAAKSSGRSAAS